MHTQICSHIMSGRVWSKQFWPFRLDVLQFAEQGVVFGIGNFRSALYVVKLAMVVQLFAQQFGTGGHMGGGGFGRGVLFGHGRGIGRGNIVGNAHSVVSSVHWCCNRATSSRHAGPRRRVM